MYVIKDNSKFYKDDGALVKDIVDATHFDLPENHVKLIARRISKSATVVEVEDNGS